MLRRPKIEKSRLPPWLRSALECCGRAWLVVIAGTLVPGCGFAAAAGDSPETPPVSAASSGMAAPSNGVTAAANWAPVASTAVAPPANGAPVASTAVAPAANGVPVTSTAVVPDAQPPFTADLAVYSDYIERGLSYSRERYSLQGHFEYDSPQGLYGGAFLVHNSAILNKETVEFDPYAGYLARLGDWTIDTGIFSWLYPHSRFDVSRNRYNTVEATVDVTYRIFGVKLWYDLKDFWGLDRGSALLNYNLQPSGSSQGSCYIDSHLSLPLPMQFLLKLHVGHQFIRNYGELDYTDWMLGVEKILGRHLTLGGAYSWTDANESLYLDPHGLDLGRRKWLAYLRWSFT